MKKIMNNHSSKVAKTLAVSVLTASCSPNPGFLEQESLKTTETNTSDSKGVSISLNLDEKSRETLLAIKPIVEELISNPDAAAEFSKSPNVFCEKYGIDYHFEIDDALYNVIVALGDREINAALMNSDFDSFMNACEKRHLFDKGQTIQLNTIFQSKEEQMIFDSIASQLNTNNISSRSVAMWVAVSVVVVIAIVIVYTVGIQKSRAENIRNSEQDTNDVAENNILKHPHILSCLHSANSTTSVLDVWALKQSKITEYQILAHYKHHLADQIVNYLKEHSPQTFEKFSEVQISEFLKRNMIV